VFVPLTCHILVWHISRNKNDGKNSPFFAFYIHFRGATKGPTTFLGPHPPLINPYTCPSSQPWPLIVLVCKSSACCIYSNINTNNVRYIEVYQQLWCMSEAQWCPVIFIIDLFTSKWCLHLYRHLVNLYTIIHQICVKSYTSPQRGILQKHLSKFPHPAGAIMGWLRLWHQFETSVALHSSGIHKYMANGGTNGVRAVCNREGRTIISQMAVGDKSLRLSSQRPQDTCVLSTIRPLTIASFIRTDLFRYTIAQQ